MFNNNDSVEVQSGILTLTRGGTSTSNFDVAATATLNFTTNYTANLGMTITGDGLTWLNSGTFTLGSAATGPDAITALNLRLASGGTLSGSGDLTIDPLGVFTWSGGVMTGGGNTNIPATASLNIIAGVFFDDRTINNSGTTTWTGGEIHSGLGAVFNNLSLFDIVGNLHFDYDRGGTVTVFNNSGTFRKSAGAGTATIDINFDNSGASGTPSCADSIDAQSGAIDFIRGFIACTP